MKEEWHDLRYIPMPTNLRILVYGNVMGAGHEELCMAWLDNMDGKLYFVPQGGIVPVTVTHWMRLPEPPNSKLVKETHLG